MPPEASLFVLPVAIMKSTGRAVGGAAAQLGAGLEPVRVGGDAVRAGAEVRVGVVAAGRGRSASPRTAGPGSPAAPAWVFGTVKEQSPSASEVQVEFRVGGDRGCGAGVGEQAELDAGQGRRPRSVPVRSPPTLTVITALLPVAGGTTWAVT